MRFTARTRPPNDLPAAKQPPGPMMPVSLILKTYPGMGRGVCSTVPIVRGTIVEVSPVVPLSAKDWKLIKQTLLESYVYAWGRTGREAALPLGFGGMFNHSDDPNLAFFLNQKRKEITFRAKRDIPALEQMTINYQWSAKDKKKYFNSPEE
jgi:SET domain-containing protein